MCCLRHSLLLLLSSPITKSARRGGHQVCHAKIGELLWLDHGSITVAGLFDMAQEEDHIFELEVTIVLFYLHNFVILSRKRHAMIVPESMVKVHVVISLISNPPSILEKL